MGHYAVVACQRHWQPSLVRLYAVVHQAVGRAELRLSLGCCLCLGHLLSVSFGLGFCLQLGSLSLCLSLPCGLLSLFLPFGGESLGLLCGLTCGSRLSRSLLPCSVLACLSCSLCSSCSSLFSCLSCSLFRQCSLACLLLELCLPCLCLCNSSLVLPCGSFCGSSLALQLGSPLACRLCCCGLSLCLGLSPETCFLHLFGHQPVYLCVKSRIFLALVGNDANDGLLLFLQSLYHLLLLVLPCLQLGFLLHAFLQQAVLLSLDGHKLLALVLHLKLFGLYLLALGTLVGGVLTDKPQTAVHLGEVLGGEYEHQLVLCRAVA